MSEVVRYFLDTEFMERQNIIELLSIGIVCEDGREYYAQNMHADWNYANPWVQKHVLPRLVGEPGKSLFVIRHELLKFISGTPEFWGYYADYDWVVFCWIFGTMMDLPDGWPMYCKDLKQLCDDMGNPKLPPNKSEHHALSDAKWNAEAYQFLQGIAHG